VRFAVWVAEVDDVVVNRVDGNATLYLTVPSEPFVCGVKHLFAPTVEDADFEIMDHVLDSRRPKAVVANRITNNRKRFIFLSRVVFTSAKKQIL